ncbi:MAG: HAD-IA family hydrolase [Waddliaceae bacterium]
MTQEPVKGIAFLFDNDGVLIDSSELHWQAWQLLMKEDAEFSMDREQFARTFGQRNDRILNETIPSISEKRREELGNRKEELFRKCARGNVSLLPGIESFLKAIKEAHIPHIIASSTPKQNLEMFLSSTVLGEYFTQYVSAEEVANGKPAPDIFIAAAERLGFDPKACVVLEDAPAGLKAAKAAGCFAVALETSHRKEELLDADLIYPLPKDLDLQEIVSRFHRIAR